MSRAGSPLRDRMIFNVGARRSGTFWLQRIVASHPAVSAVPSEPALFSHGIAPLFERFHHGARSSPHTGATYIEREALLDATRDLCDAAFAPMLEPGSKYLAERTAVHVLHLRLIADIYPDARIVHIIRDGRDVARSIFAQPWGPETIAEAAEEWRSSIETGREAGLPPDRYREVRYEALIESPEPQILALFDWLGLPAEQEVLERALAEASAKRNVDKYGQPGVATGKWRQSLSSQELRVIDEVAGGLLGELGYAPTGPTDGRADSATKRPEKARLRRGVTRAIKGRLPPAIAAWPDLHRRQRLAAGVLGSLLGGRVHELAPYTTSETLVRIRSQAGTEEARGDSGRELLNRVILGTGALAGRQLVGDAFPGAPTVGYLLSLEQGDGSADRAVFVTIAGGRVIELTIYLLPLHEPIA